MIVDNSVILLMGPQGSGKGTQATVLVEKYGWNYFASGDILRASDDPEILGQLKQGIPIDDEMMIGLFRQAVASVDNEEPILLDGYPRSADQVESLAAMLADFDRHIDVVVSITLSDKEAIRRNLLRGREDDTEAVLRKRLEWHHSEVDPVIDAFKSQNKAVEVDGEQSEEDVLAAIELALGLAYASEDR